MNTVNDLRNQFAGILVVPDTTGLTTTSNGTGIDLVSGDSPYTVSINVGVVGGTSTPTCVFQMLESADNITFTSVPGDDATATVTAAGLYQLWSQKATKQYIALGYTITGTNPVFPTSAVLYCQKHVSGTGGGSSTSPQS